MDYLIRITGQLERTFLEFSPSKPNKGSILERKDSEYYDLILAPTFGWAVEEILPTN